MRAALALLLGLGLVGCLVPRVHYDAEISRNRALSVERHTLMEKIAGLERRIRDLTRTRENLELERSLLDEERISLVDALEDLRLGNVDLHDDLERERAAREQTQAKVRELSGTYAKLVEALEQEVEAGNLEIHRLRGRLQVRALDRILFDSGSTVIKPEGREVLAQVAEQIQKLGGHRVRVEGHTDNVPISSSRFPSNWELSAARAAGVVRFLVESGLDPAKLDASGQGEFHPIAPNGAKQSRARNRRIEIVLVPEAE